MTPASPSVRISRKALTGHLRGFLRSLRNRRPETRGTYERALREFFRWFGNDGEFRFRVADVERYKRHLARRKKLSAVSVSTYLTALRRFCEYLVHARVLGMNPARLVEGNKRPQSHSRVPLGADDIEKLFGVVDRQDERGRRDYAFILLMLDCALSEIEIVRADVADLTDGADGSTMLVQGKGRTRKDAAVRIPPSVRLALGEYLAIRPSTPATEPLFTSAGNRTRGRRMTTRGVRDRVNMYLERAGIKQGRIREVTPYSLRHTAALRMAALGATPEEIRDRMRLGSVATAMLYVAQSRQEAQPPEQ